MMKQIKKPIDEETATFIKVAVFLMDYIKKRRAALLAKETERKC
jgi:hypothetical protein